MPTRAPLSITMCIRKSLSALKGAPLSTWWPTDIRFRKRDVAWTNGWCWFTCALRGDTNVHAARWCPLRYRRDTSPLCAPRSPDVAALRAGTPGLVRRVKRPPASLLNRR